MTGALLAAPDPVRASTVFLALLRRDVRVAAKELPFFLLRTIMQSRGLKIMARCTRGSLASACRTESNGARTTKPVQSTDSFGFKPQAARTDSN